MAEMRDKKVCVTGGSGFIGTHLMRSIPWAHQFWYPDHDLRDMRDAFEFINLWKPDIVFHLAAQSVVTNTEPLDSLTTNIDGTYNILEACRIVGVDSFVHISTDKVYGNNEYAKTTDPLKGTDHPYNASKLCGDIIAQLYQSYYEVPVKIIRTGNIYGPGDPHFDRIIPGTIKAILESRPVELRSDGQSIRDFIYIEDLIPAYLTISESLPGIYNLGGSPISVIELVTVIHKLMGSDLKPIINNDQHNEIPSQHVIDCPDWWNPKTSLEDGLRKTIEWYSSRA